MNIVGYLYSAPPTRLVGGEMMTLRLLQHSASQGHNVKVVVGTLSEPRTYGGLELLPGHYTGSPSALRAFHECQLLVTHPEIAKTPYQFSAHLVHVPSIGIVHNLGDANMVGIRQRTNMAIVANSEYTKFGLDSASVLGTREATIVFPPIVPPKAPISGLPNSFCTAVNLSKEKGSAIIQKLVLELDDQPFLVVIGGHGEQQPLQAKSGNVTVLGHTGTLGLPLGLTRVFIAPSRNETFGMVAAEAMALGIPVVASDIPAHHEALGDGAVYVDMDDEEGWLREVDVLMSDDGAWEKARARSLRQAAVIERRLHQTYATWDRLVEEHSRTSPRL